MLELIQKTFQEVFQVEPNQIHLDTTVENLPEWDSLRHLELVTKLEENLGHKFSMGEIVELNSIAKILEIVEQKAA